MLFAEGLGIWGINTQVVWGFAIANYVWWIGIGNAGTLISSLLLLTRQRWRASINRFAEAMTLFAAAIAGLFPILHLGRPYFFYWLTPYPNGMGLWPQWRSALVWDFWAIASYILFSLMFWYLGLLPDLATLRDRAQAPFTRRCYGVLALGWRGSARQWQLHQQLYLTLAALAVPLVCSVHSVVGLDFAASLMPAWHESLFPPYFVVGAMYSGFAMVLLLAALLRSGLKLQAMITPRHFDAMAKILLLCALIMGLSYATEWFSAWYSGEDAERRLVAYEFGGDYAPLYWLMLICNVLLPQLLWRPAARRSLPLLLFIAVMINLGMWLERILIVINTLSHGYLPDSWQRYAPTVWDWSLLFGSLGFFALLFLLLVRLLPSVSMHEMRVLLREEHPA
jgi:molybdopterin-containing oxidoreductase family membrane subunit